MPQPFLGPRRLTGGLKHSRESGRYCEKRIYFIIIFNGAESGAVSIGVAMHPTRIDKARRLQYIFNKYSACQPRLAHWQRRNYPDDSCDIRSNFHRLCRDSY